MIFPRGLGDLREILEEAGKEGEALFVMGRGTNLLVQDGGIRGTVINLSRGLKDIRLADNGAEAGAGVSLSRLADRTAQANLSGLEFAAGIPGTVGGGIKGNAGAYGGSIDRVLEHVWVMDWQGQEHRFPREVLAFSYRSCVLPREGIIVAAHFGLRKEELALIQEKMEDFQNQRRKGQPLRAKTAGSVFKNPPGGYAARIIESLGLKGKTIGGARISKIHANYIENLGGAKASDVMALIELIQGKAQKELSLRLDLEVQVVGEG